MVGTRAGKFHRALLLSPMLAIMACSLVLRLCIRYMSKATRVRLYPTLVATWVITLYLGVLWVGIVREFTEKEFRPVSVTTDFSTLLPTRTCIDRNPMLTVTKWPFLHSNGCATLTVDPVQALAWLGGVTFPRNMQLLFIFFFMRCSWRAALVGTVITAAMLIVALVAAGSSGWHAWCWASLHLLVGYVVIYLCYIRTVESREQFAWAKNVNLAADQSQRALYTLIPQNVLARLACHRYGNFIAVSLVGIIFCSILYLAAVCNTPSLPLKCLRASTCCSDDMGILYAYTHTHTHTHTHQ